MVGKRETGQGGVGRWFVGFVVVGLALWTVGCGSDDAGGGGVSNSTLDGTYAVAWYEKDTSSVAAGYGDLTFDAAGGVTLSMSLGGVTVSETGTYDVVGSGDLSITIAGETMHGGISADGSRIVFADDVSAAGAEASITVATEDGTGLSAASLNGPYDVAFFGEDATTIYSGYGTFTFDGAGTVDVSVESGGVTVTTSGTYTVNASGDLAVTVSGEVLDGRVSGDTQVITFTDNAAVDDAEIDVGTKRGSGFTTASMNGEYFLVGFTDDGSGGFMSGAGALDFDGNGNVDITLKIDATTSITIAGTYTVSAVGELTINAGSTSEGAVSADSSMLTFAETAGSSDPQINVAVRKP